LLALQVACPHAYKNITTNSFEIVVSFSMWRVNFIKVFQKWMADGLFMFNACHDVVPCCLAFP
jgi:hypothetical protein